MTSSLDMIRGRSNVVTLTNNSGGALVAGDVCIQDTSADEKVTTTTSAASTLKVFVAAEAVASGAAGRFYESGYCPLVNVNASVTRGRFLFTHTVAKQAAENATYGTGAFGKILKSGTTPSAIIYSATAQVGSSGVTRSGSTTDGHLAVWNGADADSIKDGGAVGAGGFTHTYYGYNTVGGSTEQMTQNRAYMKKITLAAAGTLINVAAYIIGKDDNVGSFSVALFDDAAGAPRHLLAVNGYAISQTILPDYTNGAGGVDARWLAMPLSVYLTAGDYWIAVMASSSTANNEYIYYDGSGADRYYTSGGGWWADAGFYTVTTSSNKYSIRASVIA